MCLTPFKVAGKLWRLDHWIADLMHMWRRLIRWIADLMHTWRHWIADLDLKMVQCPL